MIAGNSSLADNILSKNFKEIAPIFGTKTEGPEKFKSTIDGLFSVSALIDATKHITSISPSPCCKNPVQCCHHLNIAIVGKLRQMLWTNWTQFAHNAAGASMTLLILYHSVRWHWYSLFHACHHRTLT